MSTCFQCDKGNLAACLPYSCLVALPEPPNIRTRSLHRFRTLHSFYGVGEQVFETKRVATPEGLSTARSQDGTFFSGWYLLLRMVPSSQDGTFFSGWYLLLRMVPSSQDGTFFSGQYLLLRMVPSQGGVFFSGFLVVSSVRKMWQKMKR